MNVGGMGKVAAALGGRAAGFLAGPVGAGISIVSSVPLLVDLVRAFMDGGEDAAEPAKIKAQRDKVMADLTKRGMAPEEARAKVDELLRPFIDEAESKREQKPTSAGEMLLDVGVAGAGLLAGRRFGKGGAKRGAAKDAPHDTVHDAKPTTEATHVEAPLAPNRRPREEPEPLTDGRDVRHREEPEPLSDDFDSQHRGFQLMEEPPAFEGVDPMSSHGMELMAAMQRLRGNPRRPPEAYRAPPLRLGVSDETLRGLDENRMRNRMYNRQGD